MDIETHPGLLEEDVKYIEKINRLRKKRNAVILVHNYQRGEVQDIADYVGDSLGLSRQAAQTDADVIVFCGVHFMAETAAIISPEKTVLLPDLNAGCPMADMISAEDLYKARQEHPQAVVVCYVNSSAAVKAVSDICCTSSNAIAVVDFVKNAKEVLFVPDEHLGRYIASQVEANMMFWPGYCPTHHRVLPEDILRAKTEHPQAKVVVHPE